MAHNHAAAGDDPAADDDDLEPVRLTINGVISVECHADCRPGVDGLTLELMVKAGDAEAALDLLTAAATVAGLSEEQFKTLGDNFTAIVLAGDDGA
jgi:hypothetical protein